MQTLKKLQYLDVRRGTGINAALEDVLPSLPLPRRVGCADGQRAAPSRMLGERPDVEITYF